MSGKLAPLFCLLAFALLHTQYAAADQPPAGEVEQFVVLRNGEVLSGQIRRQADRYIVVANGTEMRVPARDVDFVCKSLDEAYQVQRNRVIAGRIDDHLNLADWCLRQKLLGYAAGEIGKAMEIDPRNSRLMAVDRRLKREQDLAKSNSAPQLAAAAPAAGTANISAEDLERLVRSLPGNTVEVFTATIQPMLLNSCATAGCHGPSPASKFTLLRPTIGQLPQRRLTQRNLYNTLSWVDHTSAADSKLLLAARQPHGPDSISSMAGLNYARYQELAAWVIQATQGTSWQPPTSIAAKPSTESPIVVANSLDDESNSLGIVPEATSTAAKIALQNQRNLPAAKGAKSPARGPSRSTMQLPPSGDVAPPIAMPLPNN